MKKTIKLLVVLVLMLLSGCGKEKYVTFIYNDNVHDDQKCKITEGRINCKVKEPTKEGYTFLGWYDENDNYVDPNGVFNKDITLYPEYSKNKNAEKEEDNKYVIAFDMNDGYGTMPTVEVKYGEKLSDLSKIPSRNDYVFKGFYDKKDYTKGVQYYDENGKSVRTFDRTTNIALYARWEKKDNTQAGATKNESIASVETQKTNTSTTNSYIVNNKDNNTAVSDKKVAKIENKTTETKAETKKTETKVDTKTTNTKTEENKKIDTKTSDTKKAETKVDTKTTNTKTEENKKTDTKTSDTKKTEPKVDTKTTDTKTEENKKTDTNKETEKKEEQKQPQVYAVTFNSNDKTGKTKTQNITGKTSLSSNTFEREGYVFKEWNTKADGTGTAYKDKQTIELTNNIILYAIWELIPTKTETVSLDPNTFIIKYDCNGGTNAPENHQIKNGEIFIPKANTCTRDGYIFDGWYTKDGSNWTFNVTKANFDSKKYPNNTITLYAHWDEELKNNSAIKPDSSKYKYVGKCKDLSNSGIELMQIGNYCSYESDTLNYYIIKQNRYIITYVWAKDPYNQFKMGVPAVDPNPISSRKNNNYGNTKILQYNWLGRDIMENEIKQNHYENKGLVGFNASAMIAQQWVTDSYKQNVPTGWYGQTHINIYRVNGETIRASYDKYRYNTIIYGLANDGSLKYFKSNYNSDVYVAGNDLNKQYIEDVYKIKNTFGFSPVLVEKGQKVVNNSDPNMREAICQKDKNNFAFITSTSSDRANGLSYNDMADMMVNMGCYTGFNLDGGGSTSYFYKSNVLKTNETRNNRNYSFLKAYENKSRQSTTDLVGPGSQHGIAYDCPTCSSTSTRVSADIIYFVEQ